MSEEHSPPTPKRVPRQMPAGFKMRSGAVLKGPWPPSSTPLEKASEDVPPATPQATAKSDSTQRRPEGTGEASPQVRLAGFQTAAVPVRKRRPDSSPVHDAEHEDVARAKPQVRKKAENVTRGPKTAGTSRAKRSRASVKPPAPVVPTRTSEGRFVKSYTASWYGRTRSPKPPVVDFFKGLSQRQIAASPVLAAAAKMIPTTAGGKQTEVHVIEGVYMQMALSALKQNHQADREFGRQTEKAMAAALKDARARWEQLMTIKIRLTAEVIKADKGAPRSEMLLIRDPSQIMWLDTDELVTIESVELAERIRWLTRMEPLHRLAVEELDQKYRASTDPSEREKYRKEIRDRVSRVKELESYGVRERPDAEKIVRGFAEDFLATGKYPFDH
jgi:hypothetical protein